MNWRGSKSEQHRPSQESYIRAATIQRGTPLLTGWHQAPWLKKAQQHYGLQTEKNNTGT